MSAEGRPAPGGGWFDTHCHLDAFDDPAAVTARARAAGVDAAVTVGTDLETSRRQVEIASGLDGVWAAVGVHPHDAASFSGAVLSEILRLAESERVVAIGEIGLDYYRDLSPRPAQRAAFARQLEAAKRAGLPVVLHVRDAIDDVFAVLEEEGLPARLAFHCFSAGAEEAARAAALGSFVSFAGNVSYRSAGRLREAAAAVPPGQLLVETDAPYLAPEPLRGRQNEPALVGWVGQAVADATGRSVGEVAAATSENARRLFGLSR